MPRRSLPAPRVASASVFPSAARKAPLVASTGYVFSVAWEFLVFSYFSPLGLRLM
jgi:hypothetical protein